MVTNFFKEKKYFHCSAETSFYYAFTMTTAAKILASTMTQQAHKIFC